MINCASKVRIIALLFNKSFNACQKIFITWLTKDGSIGFLSNDTIQL